MKKIILTVFMGLFIVTNSFSQESSKWIGGSLVIRNNSNDDGNSSRTSIIPELGYRLNDNWAIGGRAGFSINKRDITGGTLKEDRIYITPFAQYEFANLGKFNIFGQGELPITFVDMDFPDDGYTDENYNSIGLNVRPGLSYSFNEKWGFQMLMPSVVTIESRSDDTSYFRFGINDGYNIRDYILATSIGFIYQF